VTTLPAGSLLAVLAQIPDPRGRHGRRHTLQAMLATVICAILCGARGYAGIADWIHLQSPQIWHWLGFFRNPPTRNAFRNLLMALSPEQFEAALRRWISNILPPPEANAMLQPVALDGKTLCGTLTAHQQSVHLLAMLDQRTGCVLSQQRVDAKTNEAKTAMELLRTLVLKGRTFTGDAMFCQREVCQEIVNEGGDYFFVVKENQPTLREAIAEEFRPGFSPRYREAAATISL
jgi:hypothetical protein